jgi:hypothetical protein
MTAVANSIGFQKAKVMSSNEGALKMKGRRRRQPWELNSLHHGCAHQKKRVS